MITVINAGGSGTRLWPLSTPEYPKHLLMLTGDRSLLQTAYDRAVLFSDTIYVVTEEGHASHVREQLPELPDEAFVIEPGRRGTAHCIILALDYIARRHDHDEPVAFIHSDHHVRDTKGFARSFKIAAAAALQDKRITLIGMEPTYPSTGLGYIERDGSLHSDIYSVESFKEKPDYETAQRYVNSGNYLWNCGYFVGSVNIFLNEMQRSAPELKATFDKLAGHSEFGDAQYREAYLSLDNQVIDVALIEKTKELAVVVASFDWLDIGSFKDLHDAVERDETGNHSSGENIYALDVENVYIRNEESKPIAVIGLDNVVVVNTPNGILVARKDVSQRAGEVAKKIQN
jgi:mannose-1-phosphate guanylyltransferase/mannose-6-phosphate isomerase